MYLWFGSLASIQYANAQKAQAQQPNEYVQQAMAASMAASSQYTQSADAVLAAAAMQTQAAAGRPTVATPAARVEDYPQYREYPVISTTHRPRYRSQQNAHVHR